MQAQAALVQLAGQWKQRFDQYQSATPGQETIPPVLIVVCDNTDIADFFYRKISGESESDAATLEEVEEVEGGEDDDTPKRKTGGGKKRTVYGPSEVLSEFTNAAARKVAVRIDSKVLEDMEDLRRVVSTVGKKGQPGEHIRCVVSVAMLTEGWDANNVTQILGVRAFGSQLLCEQVVGRGLRRIDYTPDPKTGRLRPEYVDVYGIPFTVISFKGRAVNEKAPEDKLQHRVWAVPARKEMEIRFPIVEGYVFQLAKGLLRCDVDAIDELKIDPKREPTATYIRPTAGYVDTDGAVQSPFELIKQDRNAYYANTHVQSILFQITQRIVGDLLAPTRGSDDKRSRVLRLQSRHHLFPQVFGFVQAFAARRVKWNGQDQRELGLEKYATHVVQLIRDAIRPDSAAGEPPLLPILNRYRPVSSTALVEFTTTRQVTPATKSHINLVVQHSTWEGLAAKKLDECDFVKFHARNDHLGLAIPYEFDGAEHAYQPDFVVRLVNDLSLLLEIKGFEHHDQGQLGAKNNAARKWAHAVNNLGDFGRWDFLICHDLDDLVPRLKCIVI